MPDSDWYNRFYEAAQKSDAYSEYCKKVFGEDFTQQGFSDIAQIDFMLRLLSIQPADAVLDMGCGNGKMIEYVSDTTGATCRGFDFSSVAIREARRRTCGKTARLRFDEGCIGVQQYPENSLDFVISVDTVFFGEDLSKTIADIFHWLKPGGKAVIFYSPFRFDTTKSKDMLRPDGTDVAIALQAAHILYDTYDFTKEHFEHMQRKKQIITSMEQAFRKEGLSSSILYENAFRESTEGTMSYAEFTAFSTRYLYVGKKTCALCFPHGFSKKPANPPFIYY